MLKNVQWQVFFGRKRKEIYRYIKKKMIDRDWSIFDLQHEGGHERTDLVEKI